MGEDYNKYTYNDPNKIKRWLHRGRFDDAQNLLAMKEGENLLDYGTGDGQFLKILQENFKDQNLFGFEPYSGIFEQAQENLKGTEAKIFRKLEEVRGKKFEKITCLETCEHLNDQDLDSLFRNIQALAAESGRILISVPVEIGIPSLFKNIYRSIKGKYYENLNIRNSIKALLGLNIKRKATYLTPEVNFIFPHIGFDHRKFELKLAKFFQIEKKESRPFPFLGTFLNNTIYYLLKKKQKYC